MPGYITEVSHCWRDRYYMDTAHGENLPTRQHHSEHRRRLPLPLHFTITGHPNCTRNRTPIMPIELQQSDHCSVCKNSVHSVVLQRPSYMYHRSSTSSCTTFNRSCFLDKEFVLLWLESHRSSAVAVLYQKRELRQHSSLRQTQRLQYSPTYFSSGNELSTT